MFSTCHICNIVVICTLVIGYSVFYFNEKNVFAYSGYISGIEVRLLVLHQLDLRFSFTNMFCDQH